MSRTSLLAPIRDGGNRIRPFVVRAGYHSRPSFLIIGAQKAGTTALCYYLARHPLIVPGTDKELTFFAPELALARYHGNFPLPHRVGRRAVAYEATPEYMFYPSVARRIHHYAPSMKLIALLRDPVERAFSAWSTYRAFGSLGLPQLGIGSRWEPMHVGNYDQPVPPDTANRLRELYRPPDERLYRLLGRSVDW